MVVLFVLAALLVAAESRQIDMSADLLDERGVSAAVSQLSYAPVHFPDLSPKAAVERMLREQHTAALAGTRNLRLPPNNRFMSKVIADFVERLEVLRATKDCVALRHRATRNLYFSFRGTRAWRDAIPDVQLTFNARNIPRLNEARAFVASVLREFPTRQTDLHFTGHSLGGFIAQGVGADYPAAITTTVQAATVRFNRGDNYAMPRAFNADGDMMTPRAEFKNFVREGDFIASAARMYMAPGASIVRDAAVRGIGFLRNHSLKTNLPWHDVDSSPTVLARIADGFPTLWKRPRAASPQQAPPLSLEPRM